MKKDRLTYWQKKCIVPPQVVRDFASIRAQIQKVVDSCPKSITLKDALKQIKQFNSLP